MGARPTHDQPKAKTKPNPTGPAAGACGDYLVNFNGLRCLVVTGVYLIANIILLLVIRAAA